jgi:type I restriction enzyme M protein
MDSGQLQTIVRRPFGITNETFKDIEKLETDLWEAADNLRANSKLTSSDYFMPVLGVIFLRHAAKPLRGRRSPN